MSNSSNTALALTLGAGGGFALWYVLVDIPIQNVQAPSEYAARGPGSGDGAPVNAGFRLRPLQPRGRSTPTMSSSVGATSMFCASSRTSVAARDIRGAAITSGVRTTPS